MSSSFSVSLSSIPSWRRKLEEDIISKLNLQPQFPPLTLYWIWIWSERRYLAIQEQTKKRDHKWNYTSSNISTTSQVSKLACETRRVWIPVLWLTSFVNFARFISPLHHNALLELLDRGNSKVVMIDYLTSQLRDVDSMSAELFWGIYVGCNRMRFTFIPSWGTWLGLSKTKKRLWNWNCCNQAICDLISIYVKRLTRSHSRYGVGVA